MEDTLIQENDSQKNRRREKGLPESWQMEICRWLHAALILTLALPAGYTMPDQRQDALFLPLYLAGWLIFPFIGMVHLAVKRTRYYFQYLLICICILGTGSLCAAFLAGLFPVPALGMAYRISVFAEMALVMLDAEEIRRNEINRKKAMRENDIFWTKRSSVLEKPHQAGLLWFAVVYALGLCTACPNLCNLAFGSGILYLLLWLCYGTAEKRERYLSETAYIQHVPRKRIRQIGQGAVIFVMALTILAGAVSLMSSENRHYTDIRKIKPVTLPEETFEMERPPEMASDPSFIERITGRPAGPYRPSAWEPVMQAVMTAAAALFLMYGLFRLLQERFAGFRDQYEDGDLSISLKEEPDKILRIHRRRKKSRMDSEKEKIRREYRRMIRSHRKDLPACWETPAVIEEKAGISRTAEGRDLHLRYENARYSS